MVIIKDIQQGRLYSAYVNLPFDEGIDALREEKYEIISLEKNAILMMQEGPKADISRYGNWVKEGVIYLPKDGAYLTKNSPILENAFDATNANREGNWFYINRDQVDSALEDSVILRRGKTKIPTNRFGEDKITVFAFGKKASKLFGEHLWENGISAISMFIIPSGSNQKEPFATQMWSRGICDGEGSGLYGDLKTLYDSHNKVRGYMQAPKIQLSKKYKKAG